MTYTFVGQRASDWQEAGRLGHLFSVAFELEPSAGDIEAIAEIIEFAYELDLSVHRIAFSGQVMIFNLNFEDSDVEGREFFAVAEEIFDRLNERVSIVDVVFHGMVAEDDDPDLVGCALIDAPHGPQRPVIDEAEWQINSQLRELLA